MTTRATEAGAAARRGPWAVLLGALAVALLAALVRGVHHQRVPAPGADGWSGPQGAWVTTDPDGLYHARRVLRARREGRVAGTDPLLAHGEPGRPESGAPIPWPPGATWLGLVWTALLGTGDDPGRIERALAHLPLVLASLTAALALLLARAWAPAGAGAAAGAFAGVSLCLQLASLRYSYLGNADHHALATLLVSGCCGGAALAAGRGRGARLPAAAAGVLGGLALGTWVGAFPLVALTGLALVLAGGAGGAFHGAALVALLPATWGSPWIEVDPWSPLTAGLAQPTWLLAVLLGGGLGRRAGGARSGAVAGAVAAGGAILVLGRGGEALEWGRAGGEFMSRVRESRPPGLAGAVAWLGPGVLLAPLGALALGRVRHREARVLLPVALALAALCGLQARFTELAGPILLVLAALGLGLLLRPLPPVPAVALALLLAAVGQWPGLRETVARLSRPVAVISTPRAEQHRALRAALLALGPPAPGEESPAVLAPWDLGHAIEWVAERPTVATNFGSYAGPVGFRDVLDVLGARDDRQALELLRRHGAGHVLLTAGSTVPVGLPGEPVLADRLRASVGMGPAASPPPDRLRPVHLGPVLPVPLEGGEVGSPATSVALWQVVEGARIEARGEPGDLLRLTLRVEFPEAGRDVLWSAEGRVGQDGRVELRVPLACAAGPDGIRPSGGSGRARGPLSWTLGERRGELEVPERAVLEGLLLRLDD